MQNPFRFLFNNTQRSQVIGWGKLVGITGASQIIVQAVGMLSGILIIRLLSVQDYAYYTIANTMLGTMTVLADGGISSGVLSIGGEVWKDKEKLGEVVNTGLHLRKIFGLVSLLIIGPVLVYMLTDNGASLLLSLAILICLIPNFYAALSDTLYQIPFKLTQQIFPLQKNQVLVSIGRLLLTGISLVFFPFTIIALLCNALPRVLGNRRLKILLPNILSPTASVNVDYKNSILKIVKRTLPGAIYFCVSGQITIFILASFGAANNVASYGALSRIGMTVSVLSVIGSTLLVPRFARLQARKYELSKKYVLLILLAVFVSGIFLVGTYMFSDLILLLLGDKYEGLNRELVLVMLISLLSMISGLAYSLNSSRGWIINPVVLILVNLTSIVSFALLFNVSTLLGAINFQIAILVISVLLSISYGFYIIFKLPK